MADFSKSIFYSGRLSSKKPCLLLIAFLLKVARSYYDASPSFPKWQRIGRVISNVDHYGKFLSREVIENDHRFKEFTDLLVKRKEPPYILYIDKGYLDISLNHICNLEYMSGSIPRLAVVSFDREVEKQFNRFHPYIPTVTLDFSLIKKSIPENLENRRYIVYQLVLMLRYHIAAVLSNRGISFWSMQQDSIWTENFVSMEVEKTLSRCATDI
ncbi:hypothetical protein KIN20_010616 [Parelaphostrongylus tenuis]|uniref:Nucleotide-diphospho-sugar transferase domain-containing protein n=1 Tax=Parelaphostrongylus tenuis TaxID=148309 RepID=A0AAD5MU89_PARTN|nr:hypothetical protein KIN20_010616 [Parelaphostrongylus tenuis]